VILQLAVQDFTEFSPTFQFGISVVLMIASIGLIIFIVSLFMCKGPSIPGFYTKGTSVGSLLQMRRRNLDFQAAKYLEEHPIPQVKPWGDFLIKIEFDKVGNFFSCKKTKATRNAVAASDEICKVSWPQMTQRNLLQANPSASASLEMT